MKTTITTLLVISLLFISGCGTTPEEVETPTEPQALPPAETEDPTPITEVQIETNFFSLTFPTSWGEVTFMEDFAGFGPSLDGPIQEVGGRKFGFFKQSDLAFEITMIEIRHRDSEHIPEDAVLIGETATHLFYAEASGTYSTKDLEEIWETLEIS